MYESYFRLRESAFKETPDPRFFFATSSHQEAFATLSYGIERRKGIIVLTGVLSLVAGVGFAAWQRSLESPPRDGNET